MRRYKPIILFVLFLFVLIYSLWQSRKEYLHEDEWFFVRRAEFFDLYFIKHDFHNKLWYGFHAIDQPYVSYYFYGLVFHLLGTKDIGADLQAADFDQQEPTWNYKGEQTIGLWKDNYQRQFLPPEFNDKLNLILKARVGAVVLLVLCCYLFFLILNKIIGFWYGIFGVSLFLVNPVTSEYGKKALGDQLLLFFLLVFPVVLLWLVKQKSIQRLMFGFILLGICCGLALGVKPNGLLLIVYYYFFVCVIVAVKFFKKLELYWFFSPFIVISIAVFVFYILHPYIWKNPIENFFHFFKFRLSVVTTQAKIWPETSLMGNWVDRLWAMFAQLFSLPYKIDFMIFLVGFYFTSKKVLIEIQQKKISNLFIFLFYSVNLFIICYLYIGLNWQRYYWVLVPSTIFFQLHGLKTLLNMVLFKRILKCSIVNYLLKPRSKLQKMS